MKLIIAIFRAEKLLEVDRAIGQPGVVLTCVDPAFDRRDLRTPSSGHRHRSSASMVRLEVLVLNDALVAGTIAGIHRAACTPDSWREGSGHVLVVPLDEALSPDGRGLVA